MDGGTKSALSDSLHIFNAISGTPTGTTLHGMPSSASTVWPFTSLALNPSIYPQPERPTDSTVKEQDFNSIRASIRTKQVCPVHTMSSYYSHMTRISERRSSCSSLIHSSPPFTGVSSWDYRFYFFPKQNNLKNLPFLLSHSSFFMLFFNSGRCCSGWYHFLCPGQ